MLTFVEAAVPAEARFKSGPRISAYCESLFARLSASPKLFKTLGLTSCSRGEGVTTVAAELAAAAARSLGLPVVLVDCNLANPAVDRVFDVPEGPGLSDVVAETVAARDVLQPCRVENLLLLTAGEPISGAAPSFGPVKLNRLLQELKEEFALVIADLPAFAQGDAAGIGALLDGVLLVIEAEKVRWEVAQRTASLLTGADVKLLGVVMNKRRHHVPGWLYDAV